MLARTWRRPSLSLAPSSSPAGATSSSWLPAVLRQLDELDPQLEHRRRQLGELRPERDRGAGRARPAGSRSVSVRRHEPPPTSRAESATLRTNRPARSGRASDRSTSVPSARRSVSSFPTASGNSSASTISAGGRRPRTRPLAAPARELPRPPALRPEPLGDGAAGKRRELAEPAHAELLAARACGRLGERQQLERERREEAAPRSSSTTSACPGRATFAAASAANRRSAAPARGSQAEPDRCERPLERRLQAAVEALDAPRLEVDATRAPADSTEKPASSSRRRTPSHSCSAAAGSCSTSTSSGHVASASPIRIPGRTPAPRPRPSPARAAAPSRAAARAPPGRARAPAGTAAPPAARTRG